MEKVQGIGGLFFRADDPDALGEWYREALGLDMSQGIWMQDAGPTVFAPFPEKTDYFGRRDQQWMLNLRVGDLDAMIEQLSALEVDVETRAEWDTPETGRFARVHDPEGNPIELWEPPAQPA